MINFTVEILISVTETQRSKINNRAEGIICNVVNYSYRLKVETFKTKKKWKASLEERASVRILPSSEFVNSPPHVRIRARHLKGQY